MRGGLLSIRPQEEQRVTVRWANRSSWWGTVPYQKNTKLVIARHFAWCGTRTRQMAKGGRILSCDATITLRAKHSAVDFVDSGLAISRESSHQLRRHSSRVSHIFIIKNWNFIHSTFW